MKGLDFVLDRTVTIAARRETVFRYFTDSERFAAWWGAGSHIEPRAGGRVHIRFPNSIVAGGEVLEIAPPDRIVFTYGFESGQPIPIGSSRVTVTLADAAGGTLVSLRHELPSADVRDEHVQGWRYQLSLFGNVVANGRTRARRRSPIAASPRGRTDSDRRRAARAHRRPDVRLPQSLLTPPGSTTSTPTSAASSASCPASSSSGRGPPTVPGHGARRLDREGPRRRGTRQGHERLRADARRPNRPRHGVLGLSRRRLSGRSRPPGWRPRRRASAGRRSS